MFWGLRVQAEIKERFAREIKAGAPLIIRDEKTMSGRVHVGSLRGVVIHGLIFELLKNAGISSRYVFEINDFDLMDGLPVYIDKKRYEPYMGQLLYNVPSPDDSAPNFAEYWAREFIGVIERTGFAPEYYRSSEVYKAGRYNESIRQTLDNAQTIRTMYKEISGSIKDSDWLPIQVVCESCGKVGTTKATAWNGKLVTYTCLPDQVTWAKGCGNTGTVDPFDGRAKLPWKVEWAAKFKIMGVHIEGAGKDHSTKGGSRDVARHIVEEVFNYSEPLDIPYNFFVVGGKKMSSSKGEGASAFEVSSILPPHLVRLVMMPEPKKEIDFEPQGDTIPLLYDRYDGIASDFFNKIQTDWSSVFPHIHIPEKRNNLEPVFLPRFSQIAYLVQMPHVDLMEHVQEMKGSELMPSDKAEVEERSFYAKKWLEKYGPEKYQFKIQETLPAAVLEFSSEQRIALSRIDEYLRRNPNCTGEELHAYLHEIKKELAIAPQLFFSAIYSAFLGKDSGPQAGWFLTALAREFVLRRLGESSQKLPT